MNNIEWKASHHPPQSQKMKKGASHSLDESLQWKIQRYGYGLKCGHYHTFCDCETVLFQSSEEMFTDFQQTIYNN